MYLKTPLLTLLRTSVLLLVAGTAFASPQQGDTALDFTINRLDGSEFRLSDYQGKKPVHLVFWATWCPVCLAEVPELVKSYETHGADVEMLAISINASPRPIPAYVERHSLDYPVAIDLSRKVMEAYGVEGTPTQLLIDASGVVVYRGSTTPDLASLTP